MSLNTWTYALFIIEAVAYNTLDLAQYTPVGSSCLVADVSHAGMTYRSAAEMFSNGLGHIIFVANVSCSPNVLKQAV